jgi:hypothetical protein
MAPDTSYKRTDECELMEFSAYYIDRVRCEMCLDRVDRDEEELTPEKGGDAILR